MVRTQKQKCDSCQRGWWESGKLIGCAVGVKSKFSTAVASTKDSPCSDYLPTAGAPARFKVTTRFSFIPGAEHTTEMLWVALASKTIYSTGEAIAAKAQDGTRLHVYKPYPCPLPEGCYKIKKASATGLQLVKIQAPEGEAAPKFSGLLQPREGVQPLRGREIGRGRVLAELTRAMPSGYVDVNAFTDAISHPGITQFEILANIVLLSGDNTVAAIKRIGA